jgi:hypothetical protein
MLVYLLNMFRAFPTREEVKAIVNKLKNNKVPGLDGIPSEILKDGYTCL